jgi:hypothetical protein
MANSLPQRIADGTLDPRKVAVAAALGSEAALQTRAEPVGLHDHFRTRIEQIATHLSQSQCLRFGYECAKRALERWERMFPDDVRPRRALAAMGSWLAGEKSCAGLDELSRAADQSYIDWDYPELTKDIDPALCAAMEAASTCAHAPMAVHCVQKHKGHEELCHVTGWIARGGVKSAPDRAAESKLQFDRLIEMLLE